MKTMLNLLLCRCVAFIRFIRVVIFYMYLLAPKYDVCFYTFPSVLLALERVIALYAQLLGVNQTAVIVEEGFVLVAENVSERCPIQ